MALNCLLEALKYCKTHQEPAMLRRNFQIDKLLFPQFASPPQQRFSRVSSRNPKQIRTQRTMCGSRARSSCVECYQCSRTVKTHSASTRVDNRAFGLRINPTENSKSLLIYSIYIKTRLPHTAPSRRSVKNPAPKYIR